MYKPHYQVSAIGLILNTAGAALEEFSYGLQIGPLDGRTDNLGPMDAGVLENVVAAFVAYHGRSGTAISPSAVLRSVKVAPIGVNGKYSGPPQEVQAVQGGGGTSGYLHPFQVTYRVSTRGPDVLRPRRGGWYVPTPNLGIDSLTGGFSTSAANSAAGSAHDLIAALQVAAAFGDDPMTVVIAGREAAPSQPPRGPQNAEVQEVRVGTIFDTQRRRRSNLNEIYDVRSV